MHTLTLETTKTAPRDFLLVLFASLCLALAGQIAIPLWFTPVPLVTQNTLALLIGALLGPRKGALAIFFFLVQGAFGLPVFANGGAGFLTLMGPKGGYLIGYLISAYLVGALIEKKKSPILAFAAGNCTIYLCGASYLATFVGLQKAFLLGIAPFLLGDLLKTMVALKFYQKKGVQ